MAMQNRGRMASKEETRQAIGRALAHSWNTVPISPAKTKPRLPTKAEERMLKKAAREHLNSEGWTSHLHIVFGWYGGTAPALNPQWGEYNYLTEYRGGTYKVGLRRREDGRFYNV